MTLRTMAGDDGVIRTWRTNFKILWLETKVQKCEEVFIFKVITIMRYFLKKKKKHPPPNYVFVKHTKILVTPLTQRRIKTKERLVKTYEHRSDQTTEGA